MSRLIKRKIEEIWPSKNHANIVLFTPPRKSEVIEQFVRASRHHFFVVGHADEALSKLANVTLFTPDKLLNEINYRPDLTLDFAPYEQTEAQLSISQQFMLEHCFVHTYLPQLKKEAILKRSHAINNYPNYVSDLTLWKELFLERPRHLSKLDDDTIYQLTQNRGNFE